MNAEIQPPMDQCGCRDWMVGAPCRPFLMSGMVPNRVQRALVHAIVPGKRYIYTGARQGAQKTQAACVALVNASLVEPGRTSCVIAPSERNTTEAIKRCKEIFQKMGVEVVRDNLQNLEIKVGDGISRIVGLPSAASNIRGLSVSGLLVYEEAAWIGEDVATAVSSFCDEAGGAELWISTASAPIGPMFERWSTPDNGFAKFKVTIDDLVASGQRTEEFRETKRRELSATAYAQEHMAEWISSAGALLDADAIYRAYERGKSVRSVFANVLSR